MDEEMYTRARGHGRHLESVESKMRLYKAKNNPVQFHPDPVWNDEAFEERRPNNNNNNKKSSDIRLVPDPEKLKSCQFILPNKN